MLSFDFPTITYILFAVALVCAGYLLICMLPRIVRVRRKALHDDECESPTEGYPSVSVVVYTQSDAVNLATLLPQLLAQDYPAPMEVIVVTDESMDSSEDVVKEFQQHHSNLYMTFAPETSRNVSRRKLAVTLGVKAARNDMIVLTSANCLIDSPLWLRNMMRHVVHGSGMVIGFAVPTGRDGVDSDGALRRCSFDTMWDAVRYLSSAINGNPFRGDGHNLAYSRKLFFENKGFSRTLNLNYGDDDIFVSEVASSTVTEVELSADSIVSVVEDPPAMMHDIHKHRRNFTSGFLRQAPFILWRSFGLAWWVWLAASIACAVIGFPSFIPLVACVLLGIALCLPVMFVWRATARCLKLIPLMWCVPLLMLWHPVADAIFSMRGRRTRNKNFTWGWAH